jgi:hypothetical protein
MSSKAANKRVYRVVIDGDVLPGRNVDDVIKKLVRLFGRDEEKIRAMFRGQPTVIKRKLGKDKAYQYLRTISNAGAACHIDKLLPENPDDTSQLPVFVEKGKESKAEDDILSKIKQRIRERNDFSEVMRQEMMEINQVRRKSDLIILTLAGILALVALALVLYWVLD